MVKTHAIAAAGRKISQVPVRLSYHIIEHFSRGLYSSPFKAIEELVANSYDAFATHVCIIIPDPDEISAPDARIWVIDDGEGMDVNGMNELWLVGSTTKRDPDRESEERPPIGKFGIGKLATYVLGKELTHVSKVGRKYRAVTMDFEEIERKADESQFYLDLRELTADQAKGLLSEALNSDDPGSRAINLFGKHASPSWTVAVLGNLTDLARGLTPGRLKWVLATALPLNPRFKLFYNGEELRPSRTSIPVLKEWIIGKDDKVATVLGYDIRGPQRKAPRVIVPELGETHGKVQIYQASLTGGKAEKWARSEGFFVMIRGRLVNTSDAYFGLEPLSHGAFSRFRMVIHADGLDDYLRSTRESVLESAAGVINFRTYLKEKFNEARAYYEQWLGKKIAEESVSHRVSRAPLSLSRQPLVRAIKKVLDGSIRSLLLTRVPPDLDEVQRQVLVERLEQEMESEDFFKEVRLECLGIEQFMAVFDPEDQAILINILHPYFANYEEHYKNHEPFELLAVSEILTEAFLVEEDLSLDLIGRIIRRRDRLLRELVYRTQLSAVLVSELLKDSKSDWKGLEDAVYQGLRSVGFEVTRLGGKGKPDGLAWAPLGFKEGDSLEGPGYLITYDAKSSGEGRISAGTVGAATIARHKAKYNAAFALVVAPGFQGMEDENSAVVTEAKQQAITLATINDFALLVLTGSIRPLGFTRLKQMFEKCRGPLETRKWINSILDEDIPEGPLPEILDTIFEMQKSSPDPVKFAAVAERLRLKDKKFKRIREMEIEEWMQSVRRFSGGLVYIGRDVVSLEVRPERILEQVRANTGKLPEALRQRSIYSKLLEQTDQSGN